MCHIVSAIMYVCATLWVQFFFYEHQKSSCFCLQILDEHKSSPNILGLTMSLLSENATAESLKKKILQMETLLHATVTYNNELWYHCLCIVITIKNKNVWRFALQLCSILCIFDAITAYRPIF